jgi:hypothetical protein
MDDSIGVDARERTDVLARVGLYGISIAGTLVAWQYLSDHFLVKSLFPSP